MGFEELFRENYEAVSRYVARRLPPDDVQDVVSETFIVAWRRRAELRGDPLPWLLSVARRLAANHLRGQARRRALSGLLGEQPHQSLAGEPEHGSRVGAALEALSERDREALMLIAWDGLDHRAAASVMGCSTTAFTVRVHRARRRLKRSLSSQGQGRTTINQRERAIP
ncbi:MAG: RNA polymerase sigma factor [Solirubrobacteraceae bacterium]